MNTIWSPDTCDCKIKYDHDGNWIESMNKCNLHKNLPSNRAHLTVVLAHNRAFNFAFAQGRDNQRATEQEIEDFMELKFNEKMRIRNL